MTSEITFPCLPCRSINDMLEFYQALGFEVTYHQSKPNTYAVVRRGGIELHFFTLKGYDPAQSYSTCYVQTFDVDGLYQAFAEGLRQHYRKVPISGIPRLTPLRNMTGSERRFNVIDPGGNWIRIGQIVGEVSSQIAASKLSRAVETAITVFESKGDAAAAAKVLDIALAHANDDESTPTVHRVQALVTRAGIAIALEDRQLADRLLTEVRGIALNSAERAILGTELQRADELTQRIQ